MPGFFNVSKPQQHESYSELITSIRDNKALQNNNLRFDLIQLLEHKHKLFLAQMDQASPNTRRWLNESYILFLRTMKACINHPEDTALHMHQYINSPYYFQVAGPNGEYSYRSEDSLAQKTAVISLALLIASAVFIPICFPLAVAGMAMSLTVLIPSLFYLIAETIPHKRAAEKEDYKLGRTIIDTFKIEPSQANDDNFEQEVTQSMKLSS